MRQMTRGPRDRSRPRASRRLWPEASAEIVVKILADRAMPEQCSYADPRLALEGCTVDMSEMETCLASFGECVRKFGSWRMIPPPAARVGAFSSSGRKAV